LAKGKRVPRKSTTGSPKNGTTARGGSDWNLRLYVAGRSPKSRSALANLERLCNEHIPGRFRIEVVDLIANPQLARADEIIAIPTLIRKLPVPVKRLIGDLSNTEKAMIALEMRVRG
jgi:circadian clock protein KaiB